MPQIVLLACTVAVVLFGHGRMRASVAVAGAVGIGLLTGIVHIGASGDAARALGAPLAFLAGWLGTITGKKPADGELAIEMEMRSMTGAGAGEALNH